jgi:integrase
VAVSAIRFLLLSGWREREALTLRWADVDLERRELHVRQRADKYNVLGKPKSESGGRTIPMPPILRQHASRMETGMPQGRAGLRV